MGIVKRSAARPAMKRFSSEAFTEKELLVLAILCLYRFDARYFPVLETSEDSKKWFSDISQLIRDPGSTALPLSALRTFSHEANWMLGQPEGDPYHEAALFWLGISMSVYRIFFMQVNTYPCCFRPIMLHIAAVRLLDTRESLFEQRMIVDLLYYYTSLYRKNMEVSNVPMPQRRLS